MAKDVLIIPGDALIQFSSSAGTGSGQILANDDNDLVISNLVGDVLLGDGASDVFIGDGTNNVDIVFEQNGEIRDDTSGKSITLGSSTTNIFISGSNTIAMQKQGGNVAIGKTAATKELEVKGSISASNFLASTFISSPSASITNLTNTNITASGQISASGTITAGSITLTGLSNQGSEATAVMINGSDVVGTRELGSNAFTSTTIGTTTNNLTVDNSTIQLNSGTTFNGSAARTISIKNGGVDSDAMADNSIGNAELKQNDDITLQSLTTTNNISGSTIEGQTLTADVFLSSPSASLTNITTTNITASGNISASGTITTDQIYVGTNIFHDGDTNTNITFGTDTITMKAGNEAFITITEDGSQDNIVIGDGGDIDFHVKAGGSNTLFAQGSSQNIGIGTATPGEKLTVQGNISASGNITASSYTGSFVGDGSGLTSVTSTVDIDGLGALGGTGVAQSDKFMFSDAGTEKSITFSNLEDAIFGNVSGEATIAAGGALTIAANSIGNNELKQDDDITLQSLTTTNNISGSTIEGQTLTADVFLSSPSASLTNITTTNITASGQISSSGTITAEQITSTDDITAAGDITVGQSIFHSGDTDTKMVFTSDVITFTAGNEQLLQLSEGGQDKVIIGDGGDVDFHVKGGGDNTLFVQGSSQNVGVGTNTPGEKLDVIGNISASGELDVKHRFFDTGSAQLASNGGGIGDIIKIGDSSTVPGAIYQLQGGGTWGLTDADAAASATGSIAVALGANSTTNGMLLRGLAKLNHDPGGLAGAGDSKAMAAAMTKTNSLLEALLNKESNIFMDGNKVGTSLSLTTVVQ